MKLSYYPGCSLQGTALDYDQSVREICRTLGIELVDIPDWNCCGASSAHMTDHEVGMRLPMRNLLLAQQLGHDILVPCAACFQRLKAADKSLRENLQALLLLRRFQGIRRETGGMHSSGDSSPKRKTRSPIQNPKTQKSKNFMQATRGFVQRMLQ